MSRIAYVNGRYTPHDEACVHIEDRGYQFADGVYEVIMFNDGQMIDGKAHLDRLGRSLAELKMNWPMQQRALQIVMNELTRRNRLKHGFLYLQITRGVARRDHPFPENTQTSLVMTVRRSVPFSHIMDAKGIKVITMPDTRWKRCDIKSTYLLPNILSKQKAREEGAFEAWLVDDAGFVTEGSSSNAWIVTKSGELITRDLGCDILGGVTRQTMLNLACEDGIALSLRPFSVEEGKNASEALLTSTTTFIKPVVAIDDTPVGTGRPGPVFERLAALYSSYVLQERNVS